MVLNELGNTGEVVLFGQVVLFRHTLRLLYVVMPGGRRTFSEGTLESDNSVCQKTFFLTFWNVNIFDFLAH